MEKSYLAHEVEARIQEWWRLQQTYRTDMSAPILYTIDTPPPTVSGSLHVGHLFSYTQTDIIARFHRLDGQDVMYPFGFDDNGLPTERFVEKKRGVSPYVLGRSAFIKACLEETHAVEKQFRLLWERMALSVDWRLSYSTIDTVTRRLSQESFLRLYHKGFVYRKEEPALYCTACRTPIAQAELDDHIEASVFHTILFSDEEGVVYPVATTRPEMLPGAVALLYHPSDERYASLAQKRVKVPLFGQMIPVYPDESVVPTKGTGLVMCCTFGDTLDIAWYKRYSLPYRAVIGSDGKWLESTGPLSGLKAKPARDLVIKLLQEAGLLRASLPLSHTVQVHERCRTPIEFLLLPQWFLRVLPYKKELIALADEIDWYPSYMKSRYVDWVENISWDWCLSRQRLYGIPFPVWHCSECKAVLTPSYEMLPLDPQELAWQGPCTLCGSLHVLADSDVMDTWNTSSLTPLLCEALRTGDVSSVFEQTWTPMSLRPQAHDIIRTWAFYTIVKVWMHYKAIPWRAIMISGHVLSRSQEKISKSKGNAVSDPEQMLEQYSADVIRYWAASASLGQDVAFSEQQFSQGNRLIVKLWNAYRFIAEHTVGAQLLREDHLPEAMVHRWILHRITEVYQQYRLSLQKNEYAAALDLLERFFWQEFCDNYVELVKDQCLNADRYSPGDVAETKVVLFTVGLRLVQLFAPFLPYITEELFQLLYRSIMGRAGLSLHFTKFIDIQSVCIDPVSIQVMDHVLAIVSMVRRLKSEHRLPLRQELAELVIGGVFSEVLQQQLREQSQLLIGISKARSVKIQAGEVSTHIVQEADGLWYMRLQLL